MSIYDPTADNSLDKRKVIVELGFDDHVSRYEIDHDLLNTPTVRAMSVGELADFIVNEGKKLVLPDADAFLDTTLYDEEDGGLGNSDFWDGIDLE